MKLKITENFYNTEFDCKDGAPYPEDWYVTRLLPLCIALETIRKSCGGHPITITSGFRTAGHNKKVGGKKNSYHLKGKAADIKIKGMKPSDVAKIIKGLIKRGSIPQGGIGEYKTFVHYDTRGTLVRWKA